MPSTKNKTSNGLSKSVNAKSVAEGRKHLEEREICQQATELVNGYIKNMNKEFERGRQLYAQEKKRFNARQKGLIGCVQRRIAKKWFNGKKGFGFIEREDKEKDAFVHASAVKAAGMRYLNEGDKLEFTLEDGPKGPSAVNLKKLD